MKKDTPTKSTSTSAQCKRLLDALKISCGKGVSTIEAKEELNIYDPPARIYDLRHKHGCDIITVWIREQTVQGYWHRVGRYVLISEPTSSHAAE